MASFLFLKTVLLANRMQKRRNRIILGGSKSGVTNSLVVCRICNVRNANIPIFEKFDEIDILEEIQKISGVTILNDDKYSQYICDNCMKLLKGCIIFREMCLRSNKRIIEKREILVRDVMQDKHLNSENDNFYNIPSPNFSEGNHNKNISTNFVCSNCKKHITLKKRYEIHIQRCKSTTPKEKQSFLCDICGKTTKSHASLLSHKIIHDNKFPYKCDVCPYRGKSIGLLKTHQRTHMKEKPYKCPHCPTAATSSSNLKRHMQYIHSKTRPFKCTICGKDFPVNSSLQKHIQVMHMKQETVECEICFKVYSNKKVLQKHRYKVHKIKGIRHGRIPDYLLFQEKNEMNLSELGKASQKRQN